MLTLLSLNSDYGFDPLGLGEVPANLERFREAELLNVRWAMLVLLAAGREAGVFWYLARGSAGSPTNLGWD